MWGVDVGKVVYAGCLRGLSGVPDGARSGFWGCQDVPSGLFDGVRGCQDGGFERSEEGCFYPRERKSTIELLKYNI